MEGETGRSHKGARGPLGVWFSDKRRIFLALGFKQWQRLFGCSEISTTQITRTKQRHERLKQPDVRLSGEAAFIVNYRSTPKLYNEGATELDGFTILLTLCLPIGYPYSLFFLLC